jgi:thiol:disulfide interchange protein DsbD
MRRRSGELARASRAPPFTVGSARDVTSPSPSTVRSALRRCAAVAGIVACGALYAAPVRTDHVEAELVAAEAALVPGATTTVALRLKIDDGWHTYWRNPGDSGLPTTIAWRLPPGYAAGDIEWPAPRAIPVGPLVNYGYEGEVFHLVPIALPADAKPGGTATLAARADWLVCRETCIPDGADLSLALPVAAAAGDDGKWGPAIAAARAALPRPVPAWKTEARGDGQTIRLTLAPPDGAGDPGELRFFASAEGRIEPSVAQKLSRGQGGAYVLDLPVAYQLAPGFARLAGVVTASRGFADAGGVVRAASIDVPLAGTVVAGPKPQFDAAPAAAVGAGSAAPGLSLVAAMLLAFVGGAILNLMPCVFPVLSLKALSLALPAHGTQGEMRASGFAFGAGVVATFLGLAGLLIALRAMGEQVGWGFQLQSPAVVASLAVLFFVLALNLSGVFEFATLLPGAARWKLRNRYADAFLSGVLAVVIASPCTAPFMGAALGFAMAQSPATTLVVFAALGVGMALPFALLSSFPQWRRALPRPGAWMVRTKELLAFPLYATVAWLVWVLGAQLDNDAVVRLLATLTIVAFALWAWRTHRGGGGRPWAIAAVAAAVSAVVVAWPLLHGDLQAGTAAPGAAAKAEDGWQPYSQERVAALTAAGRPVFVDFTAAWCVTCQVNKRLVLNRADVRDEFARRGVVLVRADWTRRDAAITRALAVLGRNGVPVYVLYRPGRAPLLLPEVLSKGVVDDALATL